MPSIATVAACGRSGRVSAMRRGGFISCQGLDLMRILVAASRQFNAVNNRMSPRWIGRHVNSAHSRAAGTVTQVDVIEVNTGIHDADNDTLASEWADVPMIDLGKSHIGIIEWTVVAPVQRLSQRHIAHRVASHHRLQAIHRDACRDKSVKNGINNHPLALQLAQAVHIFQFNKRLMNRAGTLTTKKISSGSARQQQLGRNTQWCCRPGCR